MDIDIEQRVRLRLCRNAGDAGSISHRNRERLIFTASYGVLDGTGLTFGVNAVTFYPFPLDVDTDIAVYNGRQVTGEGMSEFLGLINNAANWISQDTSADNSADGIAPDAPFTIGDFVYDANVQSVSFAPESLTVSATEGDSGTTTLTFTVVRSNSTIGDLSFSGSIVTQGPVNDADFGGPVPTSFSGTIPAGQSSATVTITVAGDTLFEADESISLTLQSVSNPERSGLCVGQQRNSGRHDRQ